MKAKSWPAPPSNAPCPQLRQTTLKVMSAFGTLQTLTLTVSMSALGGEADSRIRACDVC